MTILKQRMFKPQGCHGCMAVLLALVPYSAISRMSICLNYLLVIDYKK